MSKVLVRIGKRGSSNDIYQRKLFLLVGSLPAGLQFQLGGVEPLQFNVGTVCICSSGAPWALQGNKV